jgi:hypothetical protein
MTLGTSFGEPGSPHPVELLQSDAVEAPVVVGWRHPAIILPTGALAQLQPAAVDALLAHELAHVARGDYGANLVQSILDVLLFFSPPARWLSARVREAREFCCDDAAVARCGGAERYAKALAAVAVLGSSPRRLALGAAGPRLIVRIRRLLREDGVTKYGGLRIGAIGAALVAVLWTGSMVTAASLERTAAAWRQSAAAGSGPGGIPVGFVPSQPGAAVTIDAVTSTTALCGAVTVPHSSGTGRLKAGATAITNRRSTPPIDHRSPHLAFRTPSAAFRIRSAFRDPNSAPQRHGPA